MTINEKQNGPGATPGAVPTDPIPSRGATSQSTDDTPNTHLTRSEVEASLPAYVLIVRLGPGRLSRRPYLSLPAAVRATERAQERGHAATLELVRLVPYGARPTTDGGADA